MLTNEQIASLKVMHDRYPAVFTSVTLEEEKIIFPTIGMNYPEKQSFSDEIEKIICCKIRIISGSKSLVIISGNNNKHLDDIFNSLNIENDKKEKPDQIQDFYNEILKLNKILDNVISDLIDAGKYDEAMNKAIELQKEGFKNAIFETAQYLQRIPGMDFEKVIEFYKKIDVKNKYYEAAQESIIMIYDEQGKVKEKFLYAMTLQDRSRADQIFTSDLLGEKGSSIVKNIGSPESLIELADLMKKLMEKDKILTEENKELAEKNEKLTDEVQDKNKSSNSVAFFK